MQEITNWICLIDVFRSQVISADDSTSRSKLKAAAAVVSVVRPLPVKSSVKRMDGDPDTKRQQIDTRQVVHKSTHLAAAAKKTQGEFNDCAINNIEIKDDDAKLSGNATELSNTTHSTNKTQTNAKTASRAAFEARKVSVMDEDEFEPDYDETETSEMERTADEMSSLQPVGHKDTDKKHKCSHRRSHKHKTSRHPSTEEHDDSNSKSRKHKKHSKKQKKHKSKSKKADK